MTERADPKSLQRAIERGLAGAQPNFADVMARVQAGAHEEALGVLEGHVDLDEPPPIVAAACDALRERLDEELAQRLAQPVVAPRFGSGRGVSGWVIAATIVAAAAVLAVVVLPRMWTAERGTQTEGDSGAVAVDAAYTGGVFGQAESKESRTRSRGRPPKVLDEEAVDPPEPAIEELVEVEPQPEPEPEREPERTNPTRKSLDERIAALDEQAQARWKSGDRAGARAAFRRIVRIGGKRKAVELAYAELFALSRQNGDDRIALWKAYLRTFPRGRYAKEASAGLCRASPKHKADACWQAHRDRFASQEQP